MKRLIALLTPVHRYLGLAFCLIFVAWFASGLGMIYARMPQYDPAERVARLPRLDPASIHLPPAEAVAHAELGSMPRRIQLTTYRSRPVVYRLLRPHDGQTIAGAARQICGRSRELAVSRCARRRTRAARNVAGPQGAMALPRPSQPGFPRSVSGRLALGRRHRRAVLWRFVTQHDVGCHRLAVAAPRRTV